MGPWDTPAFRGQPERRPGKQLCALQLYRSTIACRTVHPSYAYTFRACSKFKHWCQQLKSRPKSPQGSRAVNPPSHPESQTTMDRLSVSIFCLF